MPNYRQIAVGIGKKGLEKLDANAAEGYVSRVINGTKEFTDEMFGGNDIYDKLVNYMPTKAEATKETLNLGNQKGVDALKKYQQELDAQQARMADKMNKYDSKNLESSNDYTEKQYERFKAQHDALDAEQQRIKPYMNKTVDELKASNLTSLELTSAPTTGAKFKNLGENVKNYYTEGDASTLATRAGVTLGAYTAGAVGLRYASGGNLTTNSNGESDIAGIPFI